MDKSRVVVIGGGMGGLATALALKESGHDVLVLERDTEPPEFQADSVFEDWNRPGVPQLRHTHFFLARLQTILRDRHPEFLAELGQVGIHRSSIDEVLPAGVAKTWVPEKGDDDLLHLWGRRATFEYALRRHVGKLDHVRFMHDTRVERLVVEKEGTHLRVRGVEVRQGGKSQTIQADVVVDASGVRSKIPDMLRAEGANIVERKKTSPCAYYCRHYAQRDPNEKLPRSGTGAHVDYLVFGTFFAERGTFSIAFACPDMEEELCATLRRPEGFDEVCRHIPVLEHMISRAEPASKVFGGGGLANRWNQFSTSGAQVLGFFPIGDSYVVTNPIYGRGCSMAFVEAHVLADVIAETADPVARSRRFHARVRRLLKPHFDFCVAADQGFLARAKMARGEPVSVFDRLFSKVFENILAPALEEKPVVAREWLKTQQLREVSPPWVALLLIFYMLLLWVQRTLKGIHREKPSYAPSRVEMLQALSSALTAPPPDSSASSFPPSISPSDPPPAPLPSQLSTALGPARVPQFPGRS